MTIQQQKSEHGFSLMEMLIAIAVGAIVMASAAQLFTSGMNAATVITQRGEMQENVRSAVNLIAKDASMAGSGLPQGGVTLPYGAGNNGSSLIAVDQTARAWMTNNTYPTGIVGTTAVSNYMYGLIPGPGNGMESGGPLNVPAMAASGVAPDSVTFIYVDYSFPLNQYYANFPDNTGTTLNLAQPTPLPVGFPAIQSPNGIAVGDLILLSGGGAQAVGEVTNIAPGGTSLTFAVGDPLNINQTAAANGNLAWLSTKTGTSIGVPTAATTNVVAYRIFAISYFLEVPGAGRTPRLMRQVNSQAAVPVADNIIALSITYDMCTVTLAANCAGQRDPIGAGFSPNQIEKINIAVTGQSITSYGNKSKSMALVTSVSARNLNFKNRYN